MKVEERHGNGCYSRGCRCSVGRAARAEVQRRYKSLEGFTKYFDLGRWRSYVARKAKIESIALYEWVEARGVDRHWIYTSKPVRWDTIDRLCCAVGVPTVSLYPEFAKLEGATR